MNALLSIKPEFGKKILQGEKEYEFRRRVFSEPASVDKVFMYASSPVQQVIGYFRFTNIVEGRPDELWSQFKRVSGISDRQQFMEYFSDKETGFAIEIDEAVTLEKPVDPRHHIDDFQPPMSFSYVNGEFDYVMKPGLTS